MADTPSAGQLLIEEATKKAAIVWLSVADGQPYPVWCLWADGSLYVVSGGAEQPAPRLAHARACQVTARGDHGGRIVTWPATVTRVRPDTDEWAALVPQLIAKRLNLSTTEDTAARWAAECVISRLTPADGTAQAGADLPDSSLAAEAPETPAAQRTDTPFRLHRVRRRR